ncbi:hypothetical protein [Povalibacter sp.]|uniref:hypothetical protein n=1 Tax=Povalibacter sp. TaxID=1962978 RepID=UPI002F40372C
MNKVSSIAALAGIFAVAAASPAAAVPIRATFDGDDHQDTHQFPANARITSGATQSVSFVLP